MITLIAKWFVVAIGFLLAAHFVPGIFVATFYTALILAVAWGVLGVIVKPILMVLTLPINVITFGLFTIVINGALFWFMGSIIKGFEVDGFIPALFGAIVISLVSWFGNKIFSLGY